MPSESLTYQAFKFIDEHPDSVPFERLLDDFDLILAGLSDPTKKFYFSNLLMVFGDDRMEGSVETKIANGQVLPEEEIEMIIDESWIHRLGRYHFKGLRPEHLEWLEPEQLKGLKPEQLKALEPEQLKTLESEQLKALEPEQLKALEPEIILQVINSMEESNKNKLIAELSKSKNDKKTVNIKFFDLHIHPHDTQ